jgi:hypothetical protein
MAKFMIDSCYLLHEGGTKFYQCFRFTAEGVGKWPFPPGASKRAISLNHWGPHTGAPGPRRPVEGGQTKLLDNDQYLGQRSIKMGRGYELLQLSHENTESFTSPNAQLKFQQELTKLVGAKTRDEILIKLGIGVEATPIAAEDAALAPTPSAHSSPIATEPDSTSDPRWGSW